MRTLRVVVFSLVAASCGSQDAQVGGVPSPAAAGGSAGTGGSAAPTGGSGGSGVAGSGGVGGSGVAGSGIGGAGASGASAGSSGGDDGGLPACYGTLAAADGTCPAPCYPTSIGGCDGEDITFCVSNGATTAEVCLRRDSDGALFTEGEGYSLPGFTWLPSIDDCACGAGGAAGSGGAPPCVLLPSGACSAGIGDGCCPVSGNLYDETASCNLAVGVTLACYPTAGSCVGGAAIYCYETTGANGTVAGQAIKTSGPVFNETEGQLLALGVKTCDDPLFHEVTEGPTCLTCPDRGGQCVTTDVPPDQACPNGTVDDADPSCPDGGGGAGGVVVGGGRGCCVPN